jgi:general secretion pathway protein F
MGINLSMDEKMFSQEIAPVATSLRIEMGQTIPLPTQILLSVSEFARGYWWALFGSLFLAWFGIRSFIRSGEGRVRWDRLKLRLAIIGSLVRQIEVARFSRTLGTLIQSGVPILQAILACRQRCGGTEEDDFHVV